MMMIGVLPLVLRSVLLGRESFHYSLEPLAPLPLKVVIEWSVCQWLKAVATDSRQARHASISHNRISNAN
jgi:hypothetical protein